MVPAMTDAPSAEDPPAWFAELEVVSAATLVVFRNGPAPGAAPELLFVQRAAAMRFAGGAAVFPGGRVDAADHAFAREVAPGADAGGHAEVAARIAAIRETLEETGLAVGLAGAIDGTSAAAARRMLADEGALAPVCAAMGWRLELDHLTAFARWCPRWRRAFDTRFYLANLGTGAVDLSPDAIETTRLFWASAPATLAAADEGTVDLLFPTRRNLERLAQFADFAGARAQAQAIPPRLISPAQSMRDGVEWLTIPDGLGYPVLGEPLAQAQRAKLAP